jgi:hypothetical protein
MTAEPEDRLAQLRWAVYAMLIAVAVGNMTGRLLAVNSVNLEALEAARIADRVAQQRAQLEAAGVTGEALDAKLADFTDDLRSRIRYQRPFLSANDRSRWMTVRALVEDGTYEIDSIVGQPTWDTIDMVQHRGPDGQLHLYSSKPPLLPTLVAGEYWLIHRLTGATLADRPYEIDRTILLTVNILPLLVMYVLLARLVERFGTTDWGRMFVMASATLGTQLNTFAVVLNNHLPAAVGAAVTLYALVRIWDDAGRRTGYFALAGLAAAFTAANELPALSLLALVGLILLWQAPWKTLLVFTPAVAVVAAAFFGTNYLAHDSLRPPYLHHSATDPDDNWYNYTYTVNGQQRQSYWLHPQGLDRGERSATTYALHSLVGHHGIFSLTPIWLLSLVGTLVWLFSADPLRRNLAVMVAVVTVVCLAFYLAPGTPAARNYGGMTSGFRWLFWLAPLWLIVMLPAVDRFARSSGGKALALALLTLSVLSASYPTWNPWTHPWLFHWFQWWG